MSTAPQLPIETARLRLHLPSRDDAEAMCAYTVRNRDHLAPWDPERDEESFTPSYWHDELERVAARCRAETMNLHRLMANYMPENERSARLLERLGFVREGHARAYLRLAGAWRDHILTALVNDSWRP